MSEVTKPIALDESFNTTGQTPKNIADVIKNGLQEVAQAIDSHQGGGGHVILDQNGNALDQEPNMQFTDSHVSDDSTNEKTVIENIKSVTEAQFESATEDGLYDVDVEGAEIGEISEDYVEVTADGVKTFSQLLDSIFAQADSSKLSETSSLAVSSQILKIEAFTSSAFYFTRTRAVNSAVIESIIIRSSGSSDTSITIAQNGTVTVSDDSSYVFANGTKITLYYGNDKAVVDLQTTANRCWYDSNTTVKQKLDGFGTVISSVENATSTTASTGIPIGCRYILVEMRYEGGGVKQVYASSFIPILKDDTERFLVYNNANVSFTIYSNGNVTYKCSNSAVSNSYKIKLYFIK